MNTAPSLRSTGVRAVDPLRAAAMARALLAAHRTPGQKVAVSVLLRCIAFALGGQGNEAWGVPIVAEIAFALSEDRPRLRVAGS